MTSCLRSVVAVTSSPPRVRIVDRGDVGNPNVRNAPVQRGERGLQLGLHAAGGGAVGDQRSRVLGREPGITAPSRSTPGTSATSSSSAAPSATAIAAAASSPLTFSAAPSSSLPSRLTGEITGR